MSWRKGFFRIWILIAAFWVAGVAAFSFDGIVNPRPSERAFVFRTSMSEMRASTPEYARLSDDELADAIYKKFYSDMTREQFDVKIAKVGKSAPDIVEQYTSEYGDLERLVTEGKLTKIEFEGVDHVFMFYRSDAPREKMRLRAQEMYQRAADGLQSTSPGSGVSPRLSSRLTR